MDFKGAQKHLEDNFVRYNINNSWWITNSNKTIIRIGNEDLAIYDSIKPCNKKELNFHNGLDTEGIYYHIHRFLCGYHEGINARKIGIFHVKRKFKLLDSKE